MSDDYTILRNDSRDYNIRIAVFLAEASSAAYGPLVRRPHDPCWKNEDIKYDPIGPSAWAKRAGFEKTHEFNNANAQGYWCIQGEVALMTFRGSCNAWHWWRNLQIGTTAYQWGKENNVPVSVAVHAGYHHAITAQKDVFDEFLRELRGANPKPKYLWLTGHSMGGALAVLAATQLTIINSEAAAAEHVDPLIPRVYTYGQPAVGMSDFADKFNKTLGLAFRPVRFTNQLDPVPASPPRYSHVGVSKHIVKPGKLELTIPEAPLGLSEEQSKRFAVLRRVYEERARAADAATDAAAGLRLVDEEPPQLTPEQFADLQYAMGGGPGEGDGAADRLPGADDFSIIPDHAIADYVRLLTEIANKP